jgi:hypothetical protein
MDEVMEMLKKRIAKYESYLAAAKEFYRNNIEQLYCSNRFEERVLYCKHCGKSYLSNPRSNQYSNSILGRAFYQLKKHLEKKHNAPYVPLLYDVIRDAWDEEVKNDG